MTAVKSIKYLFGLVIAAAGLAVLVLIFAWLMCPDLTGESAERDIGQYQEIFSRRETKIDPNNPVVLYRQVDYSQAENADWYPKGESPILAKLVAEAKLPPVAQRVGPEPVVVEGVEGIGRYGGTWYRLTTETKVPEEIVSRLSYVTLVRWSPQGYPIVPHLTKSYEVFNDNREFVFHLRKGVRWSDGEPFTADDIMFWWKNIVNDRDIVSDVPNIMKVRGQVGDIEKIDDYKIKITFPFSNGVFLAKLASDGMTGKGVSYANMLSYPEHYLRKFHPSLGDSNLIDEMVKRGRFNNRIAFFKNLIEDLRNYPDYPRLWPWIYRKYKAGPPYSFIRNPYYWMVDTKGNQLPYIDRIVCEHKTQKMLPIAAAGGDVTMQQRFIPFEEYTYLMSERENGGYEVYHWYPGDRSMFVIACNINYRVDPNRPATFLKHKLLNDLRFRQAMSLSIDRESIIKAEYSGLTEAAQCAPGPASYFYEPALYKSFTEYDPERANELLDEIGLTERDYEGYRTFADGSRMTFYLNVAASFGSPGIMQLVVEDWGRVGVRVIPKIRNRGLFYTEKMGLRHEFNVWLGNSEYMPMVSPRYFVPRTSACNFAIGYAQWNQRGGLYGDPHAQSAGCIEPPVGSDCRTVMELYEQACQYSDPAEQKKVFSEILKINARNLWTINISTPPPALTIVKNGLRNVPRTAVSCWEFKSPGNAGIETYYFEQPDEAASVVAEIEDSILNVVMPPKFDDMITTDSVDSSVSSGKHILSLIKYCVLLVFVLLIIMVAVKHPYIGRRLLIMVPTLVVISVVVFIVIQAPPGDYLTSRIMMLEQQGTSISAQETKDLKELFWLDDPIHVRYARWIGLYWFASFDSKDTGLLQGNLGRSMNDSQPVNDKVGDRILLTVLISMGSILLTWALAIPIGIYSAVKQYSFGDYFFTLLGFIGMCIPSFLLALVLMYLAKVWFGITISGLFSSEYGARPDWTWGKLFDLLNHIWLPIVVLSTSGTAGMIRIMRANLLDELRKPYVITAMAKGVRPLKLLLKYPVRLALNPFVSGIGAVFPQLVSGGAVVAVVLSLPTVGPLMLEALMLEDMYLAGSMLMVLSLLGVFGTLVSDLLLLWLDPRIRFKAGTR